MKGNNTAVRAALLATLLVGAPGCLVLSLNPGYDDDSIGWDPRLLGAWVDEDDRASMEIERGEWKSYRIRYVHPIETGELTGYLTALNDARYLDVSPARGEDRGSFLVPVHMIVRIHLDGDRLELSPLSYDWFFDRLRDGKPFTGLNVALDQKENALITAPSARLRGWLRDQPPSASVFGAAAIFTRKSDKAEATRQGSAISLVW